MNETVLRNCLLLHHCEGYYKTDIEGMTMKKEKTPMSEWLKCINRLNNACVIIIVPADFADQLLVTGSDLQEYLRHSNY